MNCARQLALLCLLVAACGGYGFSQSQPAQPAQEPANLSGPANEQPAQGPTNFTGTTTTQIVDVQQNGSGYGLKSYTTSTGPVGAVYGEADGTTGFNNGVWGRTYSNAGVAVRGEAMSSSGGTGVAGFTINSRTGIGVYGHANINGYGVMGMIDSQDNSGAGIFGKAGKSCCGIPGLFEQDASDNGGYNVILMGQWLDTSSNLQTAFTLDTGGVTTYQVMATPSPNGGDLFIGRSTTSNVFRVDQTGAVYADGGYHTGGADFAESVAVKGTTSQYAAGDVLVIDEGGDRRLARASEPYSTLVAGIYSTKPGVVASPHAMGETEKSEVPLAVVGIVPCKVTTANGAIQRGDLLVTSAKSGYAMKGTDRSKMVGAIVGKALQPLPSGNGVIEVLVTLQ